MPIANDRLNLAGELRRQAVRTPASEALIYHGKALSWADLDREASNVAAGLYRLGIRKGNRVAYAVGNRPAFVGLFYGVLRAGAIASPLDLDLAPGQLRSALRRVAPRAIIAHEEIANEVMKAGPHPSPVFVIGKHPTARPFEEILQGGPATEQPAEASDLAVITFTAGSTGEPKAAVATHGSLAANLDQILSVPELPELRMGAGDVVLGALPLAGVFGLTMALGCAVRTGARILLQGRFDPQACLQEAVNEGVTVLLATPAMVRAWAGLENPESFDLSRVKLAVCVGAALSVDHAGAFRSRFGLEVFQAYGLTEAGPMVAAGKHARHRPGSAGQVLPGVDVRIVGDGGEDVEEGNPGEVWVRGPNVFRGYWDSREATEAAFSGDWLRTGDVAYRDEDSRLWLLDRKADTVDFSGFKVYPREVEEVLRRHPAVEDAAVMGDPSSNRHPGLIAFVVMRPGRTAERDELAAHCRRQLARFKVPGRFEVLEKLPRLAAGGLARRALAGRPLA